MAAVKDGASYRLSATPALVMAQLLGIASIALMLVWTLHFRGGLALESTDKQRVFNVHPVLMLIGLIYCGGQAIMVYKTVPGTRKVQKLTHLLMNLVALILGALGLYAVFKFHNDLGIQNMYTLHSWLGMSTISLFALQWLMGFLTFWFPGAAMTTRANMVPWHAFLGIVIFIMTILSAETGLVERFIFSQLVHGSQALLVNFTGLSILLFGIAIILSVILP